MAIPIYFSKREGRKDRDLKKGKMGEMGTRNKAFEGQENCHIAIHILPFLGPLSFPFWNPYLSLSFPTLPFLGPLSFHFLGP